MKKKEAKEAYLYEKLDNKKVQCQLCHHRCLINEGKTGICLVRKNMEGTLYSLVYPYTISKNIDPIEKKPLFQFQPGSTCLSIATVGCNFQCDFCQNWQISQMVRDHGQIAGDWFPPEDVVRAALKYKCRSISYTYTEPTIFFEYAYDSAKLGQEKGLKNNFVSNGYMTPEAVEMIKPYLDGINVDLKSFSEEVYRKVQRAKLSGVLETIKALKAAGIWVEITTLIVPSLNDDEKQLHQIAEFIASVGIETPWHITRFHPDYRFTSVSATPLSIIHRAREIGLKAGLRYVYTGNIPGDDGEHTYCYNCKEPIIQRFGFSVLKYDIKDSRCTHCNAPIDGVDL